MLQSPTTETSETSRASRKAETPELRRELHPITPIGELGLAAQVRGARRNIGVAALQGAMGNQAVQRMTSISRPVLQTKLKVNEPGDIYEQEADRVAEQVMRMPESPSAELAQAVQSTQRIQRCSCGGTCEKCRDESETSASAFLVQTWRSNQSGDSNRHTDAIDTQAQSPPSSEVKGPPAPEPHAVSQETLLLGGVPMDAALREFYESRFGYDFGMVRLHAGTEAESLNRYFAARAFTFGEHIWLGESQQADRSFVFAHELAHVVQQKQPRRTIGPGSGALNGSSVAGLAGMSIQRLPFFVPIDTRRGRSQTGTDLHSQILSGFSEVQIEAPVPNAVRNDYGLGYQGEADLYRSDNSQTVGIYFSGTTGAKHPDVQATVPGKHRASRSFPDNNPNFTPAKRIVLVGNGPTEIALNEMKPADQKMLIEGREQLQFYSQGFALAAKLTNEWLKLYKKTSASWSPQVSNPQIGKPPEPQASDLALADIVDAPPKSKAKFVVKQLFNPNLLGLRIPGKLYVEYYGNGLWMYYARPDNLPHALALPTGGRREDIRAAMQVADSVQQQVIGGLTRAPQQASPFPKHRTPAISGPPSRLPVVQRKKDKPPKLEDNFNFDNWNRLRGQLGTVVREDRILGSVDAKTGAVESKPGGKAFAYFNFLELAVKADEGLDNTVKTKSSLKQSSEYKDIADLAVRGKADKPGKLSHSPFELYTWVERWTSKPVEALGYFRRTFKNVFVPLANLISGYGTSLKDGLFGKISDKLKSLFDQSSAGQGGARIKRLAIAGVSKALSQIATILLPNVIHIMANTIKSGIERKLKAFFNLEAGDLVEKTFHKFDEWREKAEDFAKSFGTIFDLVTKALDTISEIVSVVQKVTGYITDAVDVVRYGIYALECEGIISCLAILAKPLQDRAIAWLGEKALKICGVRYLLAKGVHKFLPANLPATIAQNVLKFLSNLVPASLESVREIFTGDVTNEPVPDPRQIVDDECFSIDLGFSFLDGFQTSKPSKGALGEKSAKDDVEPLKKFIENVSREKLEPLQKLMQQNGITDNTPMSRDNLEKLQAALDKVEAKELNDLAEGKASPDTVAKFRPLTDLLTKIGRQTTPGRKPSHPATPRVPGPSISPPPPPDSRDPATPPTKGQAPPPSTSISGPDKAPPQYSSGQWNPRDIHISFVVGTPSPGKNLYIKSLDQERLLSQDGPTFSIYCTDVFSGSVYFFLDYYGRPRPATLNEPIVSVAWKIDGKAVMPAAHEAPQYNGPGIHLYTSFSPLFTFAVQDKDIVEMEFSIRYEKDKPPLVYKDRVQIKVIPCA